MAPGRYKALLGAAALLIALFGLSSAARGLTLYQRLETIEKEATHSDDTALRQSVEQISVTIDELPQWWRTWVTIRSLVTIPLAATYLMAGGTLLVNWRYGSHILKAVAGASLVWCAARLTVSLFGGWQLAVSGIQGQIASAIVHGVMLFCAMKRPQ
jgi:hypothetical protein